MSKIQQWVIGAALTIVLVLAAGWLMLVSPQRAKAAKLRAEIGTEQSTSDGLRTNLSVLIAQSKQLPAKRAELAKFGRQIPNSPGLPATIRALQQAATRAGVSLVSVAPSAVTPFAAPAAAGAPAPAAAAPAAPAPAAPAPAAAAPAAKAPVTPGVPVASPLQAIAWTTKLSGSYVQLEQFVANLEGLPRLFIITGFTLAPDKSPSATGAEATCSVSSCRIILDLSGQVFIAQTLAAPPGPTTTTPAPVTAK